MVTTVGGISKDEYFKEMLKEHEKFVPKWSLYLKQN